APAERIGDIRGPADQGRTDQRNRERGFAYASARRFEAEQQTGERNSGQRETPGVKRRARLRARVLDEEPCQEDAKNANGNVDIENPTPIEIGDDQAADGRPKHWT